MLCHGVRLVQPKRTRSRPTKKGDRNVVEAAHLSRHCEAPDSDCWSALDDNLPHVPASLSRPTRDGCGAHSFYRFHVAYSKVVCGTPSQNESRTVRNRIRTWGVTPRPHRLPLAHHPE